MMSAFSIVEVGADAGRLLLLSPFDEKHKRVTAELAAERNRFVASISDEVLIPYRWRTGTAHLLPEDDPRERQRWLANQLPSSAGNARAVRLFGTELLTVRIDLDG